MQNSVDVPQKIGSGTFGVVWFVLFFNLSLYFYYLYDFKNFQCFVVI